MEIWTKLSAMGLNKSQNDAVLSCISKMHRDSSSFSLIWGPPGTGKTKTISVLLWLMREMKHGTLACAPTNLAIKQVASRFLRLIKERSSDTSCLGDVLLIGNKQRMCVDGDLKEIYLHDRVRKLLGCFAPKTGWKHLLTSLSDLFENGYSQYLQYLQDQEEAEKQEEGDKQEGAKPQFKKEGAKPQFKREGDKPSSFSYIRKKFAIIYTDFIRCFKELLFHVPKSIISEVNYDNILSILEMLGEFNSMFQRRYIGDEVKEVFLYNNGEPDSRNSSIISLGKVRLKCLEQLNTLLSGLKLPQTSSKRGIRVFCIGNASTIFCTVSSSSKSNDQQKT
jgi:senataxin